MLSEPLERKYDLEKIVKTFPLVKGKFNDQEEMGRLKANFRVISKSQVPKPPTLEEASKIKDGSVQ